MSIDSAKSFDVGEFGVSLSDDNGSPILYITGGVGTPVGTQSIVPTLYLDEAANFWRKTGPNASDWELVSLEDVLSGFDLIPDAAIFNIPINRQSINFTSLSIDGDLVLNGDLWLA